MAMPNPRAPGPASYRIWRASIAWCVRICRALARPPNRRVTAGRSTELASDLGRFLDALNIAKCHLVGAKYGGSVVMQFAIEHSDRLLPLPVWFTGARQRHRQCRQDPRSRRAGMGGATQRARLGSGASAAQIAWWTDELMGKTNPRAAFGASSARVDMELETHLPRILPDADRDDAGKRLAIGCGGGGLCETNSRCACGGAAGRLLSHRRRRTGSLRQHLLRFLQEVVRFARGKPSEDAARGHGGLNACGASVALRRRLWPGSRHPDRPVHIIVPFPPGGGADSVAAARFALQGLLGEPFVVENRSGAAGRIGTGYVAKADPDGETLLVTTDPRS